MGFLILVNVLIFVLAFFLDFFELSFIVVPLLAPVADKLGIDLIWFGVLLAVNMQTSFMHPPFGFALFYLRSVAPEKPYVDKVTGKVMQPVTTMEIYKGAIPFLVLQLVMVAVLIAFPGLVTGSLDKKVDVDMDAVGAQMRDSLGAPSAGDAATSENLWGNDASGSEAPAGAASEADGAAAPADPASAASAEESSAAPTPGGYGSDDPLKSLQESIKK